MESELWPEVCRVAREEAGRRGCWRPGGREGRGGAEVFSDGVTPLVLPWAAPRDRPVGRACAREKRAKREPAGAEAVGAEAVGAAEGAWEAGRGNGSGSGRGERPGRLPSQPVAGRRLRAVRVTGPLERVPGRPGDEVPPRPAAPRKAPGAGPGHCAREPGGLRGVALPEAPAPGDPPGTGPAPFARGRYDRRGDIGRESGGWCGFGGRPRGLPARARTPHRVARWAAAKLLLNGLRLSRLRGINP